MKKRKEVYMKAIGIVAEYNPFHNGHIYQIEKIKEKYPDYCIIVVMCGNCTERGEVTIIDKWKRTKIALENKVDLVVELPFPFATQSADFFSYGAITILEYLQVEKVIFGSESDNIKDLSLIAKTQIENDEFEKLVKIYSKMGNNYPTAISLAIKDLTGKTIKTPNDLLGVSYIKTILKNNYKIIPETIKRTNDYHDINVKENISSGTSIRKYIKENKDIKNQIPKEELTYFDKIYDIEDYFPLLKYKIITEKDLSIYQTVEEGIENLLKKEILTVNSIEELKLKVKSKRFTYNKISRMLLHILFNFTKEDAKKYNKITYIRVLGFNNKGKDYLNKIKKKLKVPIISKIKREKDPMLEFEMNTTKIYDILNKNNLVEREYQNIIYLGEDYDKE